jgi:hypothetical protein
MNEAGTTTGENQFDGTTTVDGVGTINEFGTVKIKLL